MGAHWIFFDSYCLKQGIHPGSLPLNRFMNLLSDYYVEDALYNPKLKEARDQMRAAIVRYNGEDSSSIEEYAGTGNDDTPFMPDSYLEANEYGVFPGLEDGLLGG